MVAAAFFGNSALIATSAYFIGIGAVIVTGTILKKTRMFDGEPAAFVMELPAYHMPIPSNILRTTCDRGWSFIKRASTVIVAASVIIWTLNSLSFDGGLHYIGDGNGNSILNVVGSALAVIFKPLGFGNWQAAVATILGLLAKEEIVGVFGTLAEMLGNGAQIAGEAGASDSSLIIGAAFFDGSKLSAYSFMIFNLLCAPCFGAMAAIKREMNSAKWTLFAIGYMTAFAYAISFIVYQLGMFFTGSGNIIGSIIAFALIAVFIYLIVRPHKTSGNLRNVSIRK